MANKSFQVEPNFNDKIKSLEDKINHLEDELSEIKKLIISTNNLIQCRFEDSFRITHEQRELTSAIVSLIQNKLLEEEKSFKNPYSSQTGLIFPPLNVEQNLTTYKHT